METTENKKISETQEDYEKFVVFSVFDRLYCFPSQFIGEITKYETVFPLPLMPPYVLGVINRYSSPYALFDIGFLLYNKPSLIDIKIDIKMENKILIIKDSIDRIAFLIDDVLDIVDISSRSLIEVERDTLDNNLSESVSFVFNWNDKNIFVLDIHKILQHVKDTISGGV